MKKHEIVAAILIERLIEIWRQSGVDSYRNNYTVSEAGQYLLGDRFQNRIMPPDILKALQFIHSEGLARMYATTHTQPRFLFNMQAMTDYVGAKSAEETSAIHYYSLLGDDWAAEALDAFRTYLGEDDELNAVTGDTATGDTFDDWEPLKIDRDSEDFKRQFEAIETEIRRIEADNGFAHAYPQIREGLLESFKSTLSAIKNGVASKARIVGGLLKPLKGLAKRFANTAIAESAKRIVAWISDMFGGNVQ